MIPLTPDALRDRVLVFAPVGKDATLVCRALAREGIDCMVCEAPADVLREHARGAGVLLLAEEAIVDGDAWLVELIGKQEPWSDLPVLFLTRHGADSPIAARAMHALGNVTLLERPLRIFALTSAVRSALRARQRQYQTRAHLLEREQAGERKDEFLATLAHELRNPLAPIRHCVSILQRMPDNAESMPVLQVMDRQLHQMVRLVDDLLEVSRITRGKVELRTEKVELARVIAAAVETSRPLLESARHAFELRMPGKALWLHADPVRLAQVVSNLLNNAARYTDPGGNIELEVAEENGQALITVTDNGIGLAPESLDGVFEMFSQANARDIRAQSGLGIGLTLVRSLVEMHGGTVGAHSDGPGTGSRFEVRLPLVPAPALSHDSAEVSPSATSAHRVLVVDDNRDAADSLALLLSLGGAQVQVAYDGAAALQLIEDFHPRVAVLDLGMPGLSGLDVARRIRQRRELDDCELIALTGWGQESDRRLTRDAGFTHHLTKPVDIDQMQAVLASLG